uniref:hypothetical protein n=1 Tax=Prevotella phocaeensis TaxID=1776388 RepID=UPI000AB54194
AGPPAQPFLGTAPDDGNPHSQTARATAPRRGTEAGQYSCRLKGTGGHTCEPCYFIQARAIGIDITYTLQKGTHKEIKRDRTLKSDDQNTGVE